MSRMSSIARLRNKVVFLVAVVSLAIPFAARAQTPAAAQQTPAAPVPAQLLTAKKVFISNAGLDANSVAILKTINEIDQTYNRFYAAVQGWQRYDLVSSPQDADLVFEIRFVAPLTGCNGGDAYAPQFALTVFDAKTHFVLWSLSAPVGGAWRKSTWDKNFSQSLTNLMDDLKKIASPPASVPSSAQQ